jgi:hypothetical protein
LIFAEKPLTFNNVRLEAAVPLGDLTEVALPTRFIFILIGIQKAKKYLIFFKRYFFVLSCVHWPPSLKNALIRPQNLFFHSNSRWVTKKAEFYAYMESITKDANSTKG